MPAWILAALRLLGAGAAIQTGAEVAGFFVPGEPTPSPFLLSGGDGSPGDGAPPMLTLDKFGRPVKRRRRRRALTASDRSDIAFIAGMISKAAAKDFAVQLAARPR